jgi:hypothetical protein
MFFFLFLFLLSFVHEGARLLALNFLFILLYFLTALGYHYYTN